MASGRFQRIEDLAVGDLVRSFATSASNCEYTVVTHVRKNHLRGSYYCINGELRITGDHPVLVRRTNRLAWIRVDGLAFGDNFKSRDAHVAVRDLAKHDVPTMTVYVETSSGNFIMRAGDASYVVNSTCATVDTRLEPGQTRMATLAWSVSGGVEPRRRRLP